MGQIVRKQHGSRGRPLRTRIVLLGIIAGPFLAHMLYRVTPRDPLAITVGPALLSVVAAVAIWLPARRAMQQNPTLALRAE